MRWFLVDRSCVGRSVLSYSATGQGSCSYNKLIILFVIIASEEFVKKSGVSCARATCWTYVKFFRRRHQPIRETVRDVGAADDAVPAIYRSTRARPARYGSQETV